MRWFLVFLLLANLVLYLWMAYGESPRPAHEPPPPDIGRLRLLHEAEPRLAAEPLSDIGSEAKQPVEEPPPSEAAQRDSDSGAVAGSTVQPQVGGTMHEEGPEISGSAFPDIPEVTDSVAAAAMSTDRRLEMAVQPEPAGIGDPVAETAVVTVSAPVEEPVVTAQTPVAGERAGPPDSVPAAAKVASPLDAPRTADVALPPARPVDPTAASVDLPVADRCVRIGALSVDAAQDLRARIASPARVVDEERREVPIVDGYYVLIPPLPSRQAGNTKLEELSAAGVKDTWLFRSGELRNAISLGYFKRQASALRHAETVRELGFDAEVREKPVQAERLWLLVSYPATLDAEDVTAVAPDGSVVEPADCPAP
jgi:hypothetical protein